MDNHVQSARCNYLHHTPLVLLLYDKQRTAGIQIYPVQNRQLLPHDAQRTDHA